MGSACCVAARENTVPSVPGDEFSYQNIRHSPTWSFRWENRGRVAGEEASVGWLSDGISRRNGSENKIEGAYASEDGNSLDSSSFLRSAWPKSPFSEGAPGHVRTPASDRSISRNLSMDANMEVEQAESRESHAISTFSKAQMLLPSVPSASSKLTTPLSNSTPPRCLNHIPKQRLGQGCGNKVPKSGSLNHQSTAEEKSILLSCSNESTKGSFGESSDGWSVNGFSELMAASQSHGVNWSFDSERFGLVQDQLSKSSSRAINSSDRQTCGICMKFIYNNELSLSVVAVLFCGHVYHADCLEIMTPELDKYDPACPVCTFGEKRTFKMSEKVLKAELISRLKKNKKSKIQVVDEEISGEYAALDHFRKGDGFKNKSYRMGSSSSMKSSSSKPFLRRQFSYSSKGSPSSLLEDTCPRKKRFFWSKSSKE